MVMNLFGSVGSIRNASKNKKAVVVEERYSKPITDTSGTATSSSSADKAKKMADRFKAATKAGVNPLETAMIVMNPAYTATGRGGKPYNYNEQQFMKDVRAGKYNQPTPAPKPPTETAGSGINAPSPDIPWQPSGPVGPSVGGLTRQGGVPLQERVGVSTRRKINIV